ncbi:conserved protein of unknown function [Sterolibacterium denitrificans]|uniref:Uncharacterized protein n=1 Tax=Sterolibacterium denitrificans TaxID=157592 RepID=A0A7Z7HR96_9PROT|nr:hypothetical protein [Sterolibacterium denitrificans]SMB27024.1 conserved protein of unknown function [Sterolibacterium denitrificans]
MADFFHDFDAEDATRMEELARLIHEFRVSIDGLRQQYAVATAAELLAKIKAGSVAEHPAYEHYLSLTILDEMRETVRAEMRDFLPRVKRL